MHVDTQVGTTTVIQTASIYKTCGVFKRAPSTDFLFFQDDGNRDHQRRNSNPHYNLACHYNCIGDSGEQVGLRVPRRTFFDCPITSAPDVYRICDSNHQNNYHRRCNSADHGDVDVRRLRVDEGGAKLILIEQVISG